jgi:hypothetical protein
VVRTPDRDSLLDVLVGVLVKGIEPSDVSAGDVLRSPGPEGSPESDAPGLGAEEAALHARQAEEFAQDMAGALLAASRTATASGSGAAVQYVHDGRGGAAGA